MSLFTGHDLICIRGERVVFTGLTFTVRAGDAVLVVGPNGCGKSSFLRLAAGLLRPAAGTLAWEEADVWADRESHHARVHYLGHHDAVKPVLTARENLMFWGRLGEQHGTPLHRRVDDALARVGLDHLADLPGRFLSAGQKRRLNLARLLVVPAPLWLLDEPTTALDRETVAEVEAMLAEHRRHGGMVMISTHTDLRLTDPGYLQVADFAPATPAADVLGLEAEDALI